MEKAELSDFAKFTGSLDLPNKKSANDLFVEFTN